MECQIEPDVPMPEAWHEDKPSGCSTNSTEKTPSSHSCPRTIAVNSDPAVADSAAATCTAVAVVECKQEPQLTEESPDHQPKTAAALPCPTPASAVKKPHKSRGHRNGKRGIAKSQLTCKVDGCNAVLSSSKAYYQRHRVCAAHLASMSAPVDGVDSRFCQQCGKFQPIEEFDSDKRSCRTRLKRHNNRRREQRHSKSSSQYPLAADRFDYLVSAGLHSLGSSGFEPPVGQTLQGIAVTGFKTEPDPTQVSPNPSGDNSCSAAAGFQASPVTTAGSAVAAPAAAAAVAVAAVAAAGGGDETGHVDGALEGRLIARRSSANKALQALKSINVSSSSAGSEIEDDSMEEAQQHSPMVAAAAAATTAFKPRRRLNMAAATAAGMYPDEQHAAGLGSDLQGMAKQQSLGYESKFSNAEFAAAAGGGYNKCALSVASGSGSCDLGLNSRSHLGLSRFALQNPTAATAAMELGAPGQQQPQQQWMQHNTEPLQCSSSSMAASSSYQSYSMTNTLANSGSGQYVISAAIPSFVPRWHPGSLAQQHSAPPLLHAEHSDSTHAGPDMSVRAAAAASRFSDAGQLAAGAVAAYTGPHLQQQQSLLNAGRAADAHQEATAACQQQYSIYQGAAAAEARGSRDGAIATYQQQQGYWQPHMAQSSSRIGQPLSLQVLMQLRSQGLLASPTMPPPSFQQQQPSLYSHHSLPISSQPMVAGAVSQPTIRTSDGGCSHALITPAEAGTVQQQVLPGRPYVSYSGTEGCGAMLQSPLGSLTAPIRGDLAVISLDHANSITSRQGSLQQQLQQQQQQQQQRMQQHNSWPGAQPEQQLTDIGQQQQQEGLHHVLVKQGSLQPQQLQPHSQVLPRSYQLQPAAKPAVADRWISDLPHAHEQRLPLQQQETQQVQLQPQQHTPPAVTVAAAMQHHAPLESAAPHACQQADIGHQVTTYNQYDMQHQLPAVEQSTVGQQQQQQPYVAALSPEQYLPLEDDFIEQQHPCLDSDDVVPYDCTDEEAAAAAAAAEYGGGPFDEDFGDLLELLLEGETAAQ